MKNEKGYALVLVLLIIALTFTFALSMSGMALTARKQINKTDEVNKATDLAEMGIAHYESILNKLVNEANNEALQAIEAAEKVNRDSQKNNGNGNNGNGNGNGTGNGNGKVPIPDYDEEFMKNLNTKINNTVNIPTKLVEGKNSYQVLNPRIAKTQLNQIEVSFNSKGSTEKEAKTLDIKIKIEKRERSRVEKPAPLPESFLRRETNAIDFKGNGKDKDLDYPTSTYFEKNIEIHGNRIINVYGDAFFNGKVLFSGGADIVVDGDAYFKFKVEEIQNLNSAYTFCVSGNTYLIQDGKLVEYSPFPQGKKGTCVKSPNKEWYIDQHNGIKVTY